MKRLFALALTVAVFSTLLFGQVLPSGGIKNTLSTSFGKPLDSVNNSDRDEFVFYGFLETLQARFDVGKFTVEGMLNWGALTWNAADGKYNSFTFSNTSITPYWYSNRWNEGGWWTNGSTPGYYVNFLFHPFDGFDFGMGTRLGWSVGPAPSSLSHYWEPLAHIAQGGLKDAAPGYADVVGFTYYANSYTSWYEGNTTASLAARFKYKNFLEIGAALPNGVTSSYPVFNLGLMVHPFDFISLSFTCDGILQNTANLYSGLTFDFDVLVLDAWLGINMKENDDSYDDGRWGTGASVTMNFEKAGITIKPEVGFTFYNYSDYTNAWYTGGRLDWNFMEPFVIGLWSSISFGSENRDWHRENSLNYHKNWTGGSIFDIRPDFTWNLSKNHALTLYFDYQNRTKFTNENYDVWTSGFYWTYKN